jgi:hypothetical protein
MPVPLGQVAGESRWQRAQVREQTPQPEAGSGFGVAGGAGVKLAAGGARSASRAGAGARDAAVDHRAVAGGWGAPASAGTAARARTIVRDMAASLLCIVSSSGSLRRL